MSEFVLVGDDVRGLDLPAPGAWVVLPTSHVAIAPSIGERTVAAHLVDGRFDIDAVPEHSRLRLSLGGRSPMALVGRVVRMAADRDDSSEWVIVGSLAQDGRVDAVTANLTYHGTFRVQGRARAWFSGTGTVEANSGGRRWRLRHARERQVVVLDLLFDRPESPRIRMGDASGLRLVRREGRRDWTTDTSDDLRPAAG